jgi:hypothetical protein
MLSGMAASPLPEELDSFYFGYVVEACFDEFSGFIYCGGCFAGVLVCFEVD